MNLRVAIDVAFRPRAVKNRLDFAVRFPPGKAGISLSLSKPSTSRDYAIDERERKREEKKERETENKRRRNVGKVVKIVTGRPIDTRRDKRLATFARASAPQESNEWSVHDTFP